VPDRILIRNGRVITFDGADAMERRDVLVEDGRIAAVGRGIEAGDAEVLDATDRIVAPGFVDTHRHTWQTVARSVAADWTLGQYFTGLRGMLGPVYEPQDTYIGTLLGTLEALDSGVTTLVDWSHNIVTPEHGVAAYEALRDAGARAVLAYGTADGGWMDPDARCDFAGVAALRSGELHADDGRVTLAMALRGPDFSAPEIAEEEWRVARELGLRITTHVGCGLRGRGRRVAAMHERGLLGPDTTYVHCCTLHDDELDMIAATGGTAAVAPEVEMHMGHGFPATGRLLAAGVAPTISIDVCTGIGGDMFGAMRAALAMERALRHDASLRAGEAPDRLDLTTQDVLRLATIEGARAAGLGDRTGSIEPGKAADLVLLRADLLNMVPVNHPVGATVLAAGVQNVDTVLVGGRVVKRDGALVGVDLARVRRLAEASRERLFRAAAVRAGGRWAPG
jgi:5-methylthioadenosine/S-adenosylhomocysteine deaminase